MYGIFSREVRNEVLRYLLGFVFGFLALRTSTDILPKVARGVCLVILCIDLAIKVKQYINNDSFLEVCVAIVIINLSGRFLISQLLRLFYFDALMKKTWLKLSKLLNSVVFTLTFFWLIILFIVLDLFISCIKYFRIFRKD